VGRNYHTLNSQTRVSEEKLTWFLKKNGQHLLPMVDLITQSRMAIDELIDSVGRATLETILEVSAEQVVGARQPGKTREGAVGWYGRQPGRVYLGDRKLAVERPRLCRRGRGQDKEVMVPAYAALQNRQGMQRRMLDILMNGVSTRHYQHVIPEMAESVGISKSSVSRETIEAAEAALQKLLERGLDDKDFLIIYIDGLHFGEHRVIGELWVWTRKGISGCWASTKERPRTARRADLLQNLVERGLDPEATVIHHRWFESLAQRH
jgi:putative transposase